MSRACCTKDFPIFSQSNNNHYANLRSTSCEKTFPLRTMKMKTWLGMRGECFINQKSWKEPRNRVARRPDKRTHKFVVLLRIPIFVSLPAFNQIMLYILTYLLRGTKNIENYVLRNRNMKNISRGRRSMEFSSGEIKKKHKVFTLRRNDKSDKVSVINFAIKRWMIKPTCR